MKDPRLRGLPRPSERPIAIRLFPRAERAIARGHPWLFDHGIRRQARDGEPGDLAVLFDSNNRFLAVGLFDPFSPIRVRVLQYGRPATIDGGWFAERLASAAARRSGFEGEGTTGYRVVNGANDGLPGLVIDRYADVYVMKLYTHAWLPHLPAFIDRVLEILRPGSLVLRLNRRMQASPDDLHGLADGDVLHGDAISKAVLFLENGLIFEADVLRGQKTGFFLDQRDNRLRVQRLAEGRSVLNVFSYSGGFSVYAARGGATEVVSLDLSAGALGAAKRNFEHNADDPAVAAARHRTVRGDAFDVLADLRRSGRRFDLVILDPPAFAKSGSQVDNAIRSYRKLVRLGLDLLTPGGTLVAASCSSRIDAERFAAVVQDAAGTAGRPLRLIEQTGHACDHPVTFPEGEYLTCVFASDPGGSSA